MWLSISLISTSLGKGRNLTHFYHFPLICGGKCILKSTLVIPIKWVTNPDLVDKLGDLGLEKAARDQSREGNVPQFIADHFLIVGKANEVALLPVHHSLLQVMD